MIPSLLSATGWAIIFGAQAYTIVSPHSHPSALHSYLCVSSIITMAGSEMLSMIIWPFNPALATKMLQSTCDSIILLVKLEQNY